MRQGTVPREASPPRDGVLALAFHTLLSFQGTSPGCSSATHLRFPRLGAAGAAGRYHGPLKIVKDFPPVRSAYSWWSTTRHVDILRQKRRPAPGASGRQDGHRTAVGSTPGGVRRPPVFRCRRRRRRPGEVLGPEELPCLQLREGSTVFDTVSTRCTLSDTKTHNGSSRFGIPGGAAGPGVVGSAGGAGLGRGRLGRGRRGRAPTANRGAEERRGPPADRGRPQPTLPGHGVAMATNLQMWTSIRRPTPAGRR